MLYHIEKLSPDQLKLLGSTFPQNHSGFLNNQSNMTFNVDKSMKFQVILKIVKIKLRMAK